MKNEFKKDSCLLAVYNFTFEPKEGFITSKQVIFSWVPLTAKVNQRMVYSKGPGYLKGICDNTNIIIQADNLDDITEEAMKDKAMKFIRF